MFRLPPELTQHLEHGGTLIVPTRQRARAVQLAYAAARLAQGLHTWTSADVLSLAGWLRRETERAASIAPGEWPRLLSAAEDWYLWREATAAAASGFELLDGQRLSESLRRAAALAADYGIALKELPGDAEATLLARAQRVFAQRCRDLAAVTAPQLAQRLAERAERSAAAPWLRGFEAVPPHLRSFAAPGAAPARTQGGAQRSATAADELEAIAGWCQALVQRQPDARVLVMLPGAQGPRERLAALIREALDPASVLDPRRRPRALAAVEGGAPLTEVPLIAHALLSLRILRGEEVEFAELAAWLRAPHWHSPAAGARAALMLLWRERPVASLDVRELVGALKLAPPRLAAAAVDLTARLALAQAALEALRQRPASGPNAAWQPLPRSA